MRAHVQLQPDDAGLLAPLADKGKTTTLLIVISLGRSLKLDSYGRPKCCSDGPAPTPRQLQDWAATLREATYRSLTRHLDYPGGLDGRLDRDHTLWKLLQRATILPPHPPSSLGSEIGVLVEKLRSGQVEFEFRQLDKSLLECLPGPCSLKNDSIIALWRVRRSDNPFAMWIQVKLPKIKDHPIEDVYEYSAKFGLKKINPDPTQYNSFAFEKPHRFSVRGKSSFNGEDRMDFPFAKVFGIGRITPTSFIYEPPMIPGKGDEGWLIQAPRRPHPGVVVDTGIKGPLPHNAHTPFSMIGGKGPSHNTHTPFSVIGGKGFHHVIHSLQSLPPPQSLDRPHHNFKGFLPSTGPMNAPPPYEYDPPFVLYYNRPDTTSYPTRPPTQFKPSTEFVRYSEVDPFYHPNGEQDMLSTTPTPFRNFQITGFPQSINDQLPTNSPIENTRPPFQIIVGDEKSSHRSTTSKPKSIEEPATTTDTPQNRFVSRPRTKSTDIPTTEKIKTTTKQFGEKIRPKTSVSGTQTTTRTREKLTTKPFSVNNKKKITTFIPEKKNKSRNNTEIGDFVKTPQNVKVTTGKVENIVTTKFKNFATAPTRPDDTEITELLNESTTEKIESQTMNVRTETTELGPFNYKNNSEEVQTETEEKVTTYENSFDTTSKTVEKSLTATTPRRKSSSQTEIPQVESTTEDFLSNDLTTINNEPTQYNITSGIGDFFTSLTDMFSMETTTEKYEETTTLTAQKTTAENDADTQESKQHNYRLVTFPGDTVSIVANHISQSVSYRTAGGKEGTLRTKKPTDHRFRYSDTYKDYSTIL